jgi:hypothetical protein
MLGVKGFVVFSLSIIYVLDVSVTHEKNSYALRPETTGARLGISYGSACWKIKAD